MERYSKLWQMMPENLYSENSPVIVRAGAILKDNETDKILIQLKFENISDKTIKALKIKLNLFNIEKQTLVTDTEHQYLDLAVKYKETFGQNLPVIVTDKTVRSFEITEITAIFDNTVWKSSEKYISISKPENYLLNISDSSLLGNFINETKKSIFWSKHSDTMALLNNTIIELHKYKSSNSELSNKKIAEYSEILNTKRDADSDFSEDEKLAISNIDSVIELLKGEKAVQKNDAKKRRKKKALITIGIILLTIILLIAGAIFLLINTGYNTAVANLNNEEYEAAIADFEILGSFKDSEEKLLEAKFGLAEKMEGISIAEAYNLYKKMPESYPGVNEKLSFLEQYITYTQKYKKISIVTTDGTGKVLTSEEMFDNDAGITINLCIKDEKLCYAPDALIKYNSSLGTETFTFEYAVFEISEDEEFKYYCEYNNGFGNNDFIYISENELKIINKDIGLRGEEYDRITTTLYNK